MFCPNCTRTNLPDADQCRHCQQDTSQFRQRLFIGRQFIFVRADEGHSIALKVDGEIQVYRRPAILSRHHHAVGFGDETAPVRPVKPRRRLFSRQEPQATIRPLPDQPRLPTPALRLMTLVSDRKIYQPNTEAALFIVAPDAAGQEAALEIQIAGQKVYEVTVPLNRDGLALHSYDDLKEGEYTALVALPDGSRAECTFSVAEFTLSPLIATLEKHAYAEKRLSFTLRLLLLSQPYSGPAEFGLQCQVCGNRVVATQEVSVRDGVAEGDFDIAGHGGPFHVQITTPDGNAALVAFPGTGRLEREHIKANTLGQTAELGLLPWESAEPVRGLYVGHDEVHMTPLVLSEVLAERGSLKAAADIALAQVITLNPNSGESSTSEHADLKRDEVVDFETADPYTLFTVAVLPADGSNEPFEGWGIVIRPVAFEAVLTAPESARPGEEIDIYVEIPAEDEDAPPVPAFCWLLVYDARLEHESPIPRLAKRIYESVRDATGNLNAGPVVNALDARWSPLVDFMGGPMVLAAMPSGPGLLRRATAVMEPSAVSFAPPPQAAAPAGGVLSDAMDVATMLEKQLQMTMSPWPMSSSRMEFPELAYQELFAFAGQGARTVRLGDQIGTWRARAYVFKGRDYRELTADIQADKPLYAELDLPAIASEGDEIDAAVTYFSREPAELIIATPSGESRAQVQGGGSQRFTIRGPGRVEVHLRGPDGSDMSARYVAPPGVQTVTTSQLHILDRGESVAGERVVVYASMGQVLKETITALTDYPFG